jgi:hypothetical protein
MQKEGGHPMRGQDSDPYERLLVQWKTKRELVNTYHRALHFVTPDLGDATERRRDLNQKIATTLVTLRRTTDQLHQCEEWRATESSH